MDREKKKNREIRKWFVTKKGVALTIHFKDYEVGIILINGLSYVQIDYLLTKYLFTGYI